MKIVNNVEELMEIIGIKKGDTVNIMSPQFQREYELEIDFIPKSIEEFEAIKHLPRQILYKMGVRVWEVDKHGYVIYLFPGEWYSSLPQNLSIVTINGKTENFISGETDNDIRFGCLSYGFKRFEE